MNAISDLLHNSVTHESVRDRVDPRVQLGAWVGLGLIIAQGVMMRLGSDATSGLPTWGIVRWAFTGAGHPDLVLGATAIAVAFGLALGVASSGFRRAARIGQLGQLALLGVGGAAALPMAWVALVSLAVIAFFVAIVVLVLAAIVFVLSA